MVAALIEELLDSVNSARRIDNDIIWAKEAEDRIDAYEAGQLKSLSVEKVFQNLNWNSKESFDYNLRL